MERFDIDKIRSLNIETVAERLGLHVSRHKALCPFHEDSHPSLTFRVATNSFRCFVCGKGGGVIDLAMKILNKNFYDACLWLANENNILLSEPRSPTPYTKLPTPKKYPPDVEYLSRFFRQPVLNAEAQRFLFEERKIDPRVVHWLGITSISQPTPCWRYGKPYYDAPSLLFPYRDVDGNLLNVQSRYLGPKVESGDMRDEGNSLTPKPSTLNPPRFRFPSGSQCHIFGLQILKLLKPGEPLYISEGITDCMALMSAGHKTIAIPSATLLKEEDLKPIKELAEKLSSRACGEPVEPLELHIYPDKDQAGESLYRQLAYLAPKIGCLLIRETLPEGYKDFGAYWASLKS